jgi:signal peptidase I
MLFEGLLILAIVASLFIVSLDRILQPHPVATEKRPYLIKTINAILPALIILFLIRAFIFEGFRIPTASMKPTLIEGDWIIVDKYSTGLRLPLIGTRISKATPKRGDIVVIRGNIASENDPIIKRIVGLPGDHICYQDRTLYINGQPNFYNNLTIELEERSDGTSNKVIKANTELDLLQHQIYLAWDKPNSFESTDLIVPQDCFFVLGDYRDNSQDSRIWGVVPDRYIVGKARSIVLSVDWWHAKIRWQRLGKIS